MAIFENVAKSRKKFRGRNIFFAFRDELDNSRHLKNYWPSKIRDFSNAAKSRKKTFWLYFFSFSTN